MQVQCALCTLQGFGSWLSVAKCKCRKLNQNNFTLSMAFLLIMTTNYTVAKTLHAQEFVRPKGEKEKSNRQGRNEQN